jgi:hypothetical protein
MTIQQRTKRTLPLTSNQRNTKKDNIQHWKSRSWLGTDTKMGQS